MNRDTLINKKYTSVKPPVRISDRWLAVATLEETCQKANNSSAVSDSSVSVAAVQTFAIQ